MLMKRKEKGVGREVEKSRQGTDAGSGVIWNAIPFETQVIPAKAGIQSVSGGFSMACGWIPAFAGMTAHGSAHISQMTPVPARVRAAASTINFSRPRV